MMHSTLYEYTRTLLVSVTKNTHNAQDQMTIVRNKFLFASAKLIILVLCLSSQIHYI